jgi:diacylglycerol kinase family enzyme
MEVHETRSLYELDAVMDKIAARGTSAVVLAGGDGSYMAGVTALWKRLGDGMPPVALAPGGTVSTVARNWGLRGSASSYAKRLLRAVVEGTATATRRPTLRATDDEGGDRVGFIFGAGLVASFFDVYYASPHQGYSGAARIVARIFAGSFVGGAMARRVLTPTPCTLTVDGIEQPARAYSLIAASVVKDLGLHMHLLYRAAEDLSRFHLVASALPPSKLGPQMPRVLAGKRLCGEHHVDALAGTARVRFTEPGRAYVLDGDVLVAREVTVTPGPILTVLSA